MKRTWIGAVAVTLALALSACSGAPKSGGEEFSGKGDWDPAAAGDRKLAQVDANRILKGYGAEPKIKWELDPTTILGSKNDNQINPVLDMSISGKPKLLVLGVSQLIKDTERKNFLAGVDSDTGKVLWQTAVGESNGHMNCGIIAKTAAVACFHQAGKEFVVDVVSSDGKKADRVKLAPRSSSFGKPGFATGSEGFAVSENTQDTPAKLIYFDASGKQQWAKEIVSMGIDPQFSDSAVYGADYSFKLKDGSKGEPAYLSNKYQAKFAEVSPSQVKFGNATVELKKGERVAIPGPIDKLVPAVLVAKGEYVTAYSPDGKAQWALKGVSSNGFGFCGDRLYFAGSDPQKKLVVADVLTGKRLTEVSMFFDPEQFFCTDTGNAVLNNKQDRAMIGIEGASAKVQWSIPMKFGFGDQIFAVSQGLLHADNRSKDQPILQFLEN